MRTGGLIAAVALAATGAAAIKMASSFETAFAEVGTLFEAPKEQIDELRSDVLDLSKTMGIDAVEATKSLYQAISAGVAPAEAVAFLAKNVELAVGGVTDLETAVDLTTTVMNAWQLESSELTRVMDVMFATVQEGKTTVGELGASMFNVAPIAASAGVSIEEVSAALAALTAQGVPTSEATTQLRQAIVSLVAPGRRQVKIATEMGIVLNEQTLRTKGLGAALGDLIKQTDGDKESLKRLLGSIEAVNAALIIGGTGAADYAENLDIATNAAGLTKDAFEEMNETFGRQVSILTNQLKGILIEIGLDVLPLLTDAVTKLAEWVGEELPKVIDSAKEKFSEWIAVIQEVDDVLRDMFNFVIRNQVALVAAITLIGLALASAFGPVGIALAAGGAVIVGLALFRTELDKLSAPALQFRKDMLFIARDALVLGRHLSTLGLDTIPKVGEALGDFIDPATSDAIDSMNERIEDLNVAFTHLRRQASDTTISQILGIEEIDLATASAEELIEHEAELTKGKRDLQVAQDTLNRTILEASPPQIGYLEALQKTAEEGRTLEGLLFEIEKGQNAFNFTIARTIDFMRGGFDIAESLTEQYDKYKHVMSAANQAQIEAIISAGDLNATLEFLARQAINTGIGFSQMTDEMLVSVAVGNEVARMWTSVNAAQQGFGTPDSIDEILNRIIAARERLAVAAGPSGGGFFTPAPVNLSPAAIAEPDIETIEEMWTRLGQEIAEAIGTAIAGGARSDNSLLAFLDEAFQFMEDVPARFADAVNPILAVIQQGAAVVSNIQDVMDDAIERGFVRIGDITRLLSEGAIDAAQDFLDAFLGKESEIGIKISEAAAEKAREAAEEFAEEFGNTLVDSLDNLDSIFNTWVQRAMSQLSSLLNAPTVESAATDVRIAELKIQENDLLEKAERDRLFRLEIIERIEENILSIREAAQAEVENLEGLLGELREGEAALVEDLQGQIEASREAEREQLDALNDQVSALRKAEREETRLLQDDLEALRRRNFDQQVELEEALEEVREKNRLRQIAIEDELEALKESNVAALKLATEELGIAQDEAREKQRAANDIRREVERSDARVLPITLAKRLAIAEAEEEAANAALEAAEERKEALKEEQKAAEEALKDQIAAIKEETRVARELAADKIGAIREETRLAQQEARDRIQLLKDTLDAELALLADEKEAIETVAGARQEALEEEIEMVHIQADLVREFLERAIENTNKAADAAIARMEDAIEAWEKWRFEAEKQVEAINAEIEALEKLNTRRQLERDLMEARARAADATLKTEAEVIASIEEMIGKIADGTSQLLILQGILDEVIRGITEGMAAPILANLLQHLGLDDLAAELLAASLGLSDATLSEVLERAIKALHDAGLIESPLIPTLHQGGFIPAGQEGLARLRGPEAVVPMGSNMFSQLLGALGGAGGGGGEMGFRNYGTIQLLAAGDSDHRALKSISRSLEVT